MVSSKLEYEDAIEFGVKPEKLWIIPMGVDVEAWPDCEKQNPDRPLQVLFVGRLARVRRVELLLQALKRVDIPFHATIVGGEEKTGSLSRSGYFRELESLSIGLGLNGLVEFVGPQTGDRLKAFYRASDVFVYPSLYENFGQPILEAAASGLPVICTDVGVARELVKSGETGFIVPGEPGEISKKIMELGDSVTRKDFGRTIQKRVENNFGWNKIMKDYLALYESL